MALLGLLDADSHADRQQYCGFMQRGDLVAPNQT
jgi:hypothetical protein